MTESPSLLPEEIHIGDHVSVMWRGPTGNPFYGIVRELYWGPLATDGLIELRDGTFRVFASDCHIMSKFLSLLPS
jgi:hypothetical protein